MTTDCKFNGTLPTASDLIHHWTRQVFSESYSFLLYTLMNMLAYFCFYLVSRVGGEFLSVMIAETTDVRT